MATKLVLRIHPKEPKVNYDDEDDFVQQYGTDHVIIKREHSIIPDLAQYKFPDNIKERADIIFNSMNYQVHRKKLRTQMLFYCVYCAYREEFNKNPCYENGMTGVDPFRLGARFGLTSGEVSKCNSIFSPLQTGYRPPPSYKTPMEYLLEFHANLKLSEDSADEIISLADGILKKNKGLFQENPQTVAAGLIKYFTVINGIIVNDDILTNATGRSKATIDAMYRKISTIDNT